MNMDVAVPLKELLEWHRIHERFEEVLEDLIVETLLPELDYETEDPPDVTILNYSAVRVSQPNSIVFATRFDIQE